MDKLKAVKIATIVYTNSRDRWETLARKGATNREITEELNHNFGYGGGSSGPGRAYIRYKSKPPRVWIEPNMQGKDKPDIRGRELVSLTRRVYGIGPPGQMHLFNA